MYNWGGGENYQKALSNDSEKGDSANIVKGK